MSVTFQFPRSARRSDYDATPGQTVFGPTGWLAFDVADIVVRRRPLAAVNGRWVTVTTGVTVTLTAPVAGYVTATFDGAQTGYQVRVEARRVHPRTLDVTRAGSIQTALLERELDKQASVLQEVRRDINDALSTNDDQDDRLNAQDLDLADMDGRVTQAQADATQALSIIGQNFPIPALVQFEYSPRSFFADPTGTIDSSGAFLAALATGNVKCHPGDIYKIGNIDVPGGRTLTGNGAQFRPATNADYVLRLKGYRPIVQDVNCDGFSENHVVKTVLAGAAAPGATVLAVASAARFKLRMPVLVVTPDLAAHLSLIAAVDMFGGTITLRDALPAGADAGAAVFASFGLLHVQDATWATIRDCSTVNGAFSLMMVPSAGPTVTSKSIITNFQIDTERYIGFGKFENTGDVVIDTLLSRGGKVVTDTFSGTGGAGNYPLQRPLYLFRNLGVRVNGVLQAYGTDYVVGGAHGTEVQFLPGHYPAVGATVTVNHNFQGYYGFVDDQRVPSGLILPSGNRYWNVQCLGYDYGIVARGSFLTDYFAPLADTCAKAGIVVDNALAVPGQLSFVDAYSGFNPDAINVYGASARFFGKTELNLVPASEWWGGVLGAAIRTNGTGKVDIDAERLMIDSNAFIIAGSGEVDCNGGDTIDFATDQLNPNGVDRVGQDGKLITAGGVPYVLPNKGQTLKIVAECGVAPGAGESFTYELYLNNLPTGLKCIISGAGTFVSEAFKMASYARWSTADLSVARSAGAAVSRHRIVVQTTS